LFGFDLFHIVFDAAFLAWVYPYIVFDILDGMLRFEPFFEPFFNHKAHLSSAFTVHIDLRHRPLNAENGRFGGFSLPGRWRLAFWGRFDYIMITIENSRRVAAM